MATKGLKRGTRNKFARPFRYHGDTHIHKLLTKYRLGDYVDIKVLSFAITIISRSMELSTEECPTNFTTGKLERSLTLTLVPWALLSINKSETDYKKKEFMSELSISKNQNAGMTF